MARAPDAVILSPDGTTNVRLVAVDGDREPTFLRRAADLETAVLIVAAAAGVAAVDMPGLYGLCVEAIRSAERHGR